MIEPRNTYGVTVKANGRQGHIVETNWDGDEPHYLVTYDGYVHSDLPLQVDAAQPEPAWFTADELQVY